MFPLKSMAGELFPVSRNFTYLVRGPWTVRCLRGPDGRWVRKAHMQWRDCMNHMYHSWPRGLQATCAMIFARTMHMFREEGLWTTCTMRRVHEKQVRHREWAKIQFLAFCYELCLDIKNFWYWSNRRSQLMCKDCFIKKKLTLDQPGAMLT